MTLLEMGRRFHAASGIPCGFDGDAFLLAMERCGVFTTEKGFIAGMLVPSPICPSWVMAVELAWWSEDGKGLSLLRKFEKWARQSGASEIRMTTLSDMPRAGEIMPRLGYRSVEVSWTKVI